MRDNDDAVSYKQDPIEDTQTKILSPTIRHVQNQTHTTNKFSNFGYFGGASSPRATAMVGVAGNIENQEDDIEVSIEEAIEDNLLEISRQRETEKKTTKHNPNLGLRELQKQKSTQPMMEKSLLPKATESPKV